MLVRIALLAEAIEVRAVEISEASLVLPIDSYVSIWIDGWLLVGWLVVLIVERGPLQVFKTFFLVW